MADNDEQDETEEVQQADAPVTDQSNYEPVPLPPTSPMVAAAPQPTIAGPIPPPGAINFTPITSGPRPPTDRRAELFRRQAASNDALWRQLQQRTSNLPIAQTEAAVSAALRFQGQRQYQRDLAAGMAPAEALARSAPLIFNAPKAGSLGQAGSFIRATTPTRKFHDVGGVLYRENPDGTVTAVSGPGRPRFHSSRGVLYREGPNGTLEPATTGTAKTSPFDTEEYRSVLTEIRAANKELTDMTAGEPTLNAEQAKDIEPLRNRLRFLQGQLESIRSRSTGGPAERSPQRPQAPRPSEVVRYTKEGRRAVFDSNSRKFVRYLD